MSPGSETSGRAPRSSHCAARRVAKINRGVWAFSVQAGSWRQRQRRGIATIRGRTLSPVRQHSFLFLGERVLSNSSDAKPLPGPPSALGKAYEACLTTLGAGSGPDRRPRRSGASCAKCCQLSRIFTRGPSPWPSEALSFRGARALNAPSRVAPQARGPGWVSSHFWRERGTSGFSRAILLPLFPRPHAARRAARLPPSVLF